MAPHSTKSLTLVFCIFLFCFFSCPVSASRTPNSVSDTEKVELGVYYESLCPYSANFIINYLVKIFEDDELFSIIDLHLSPWGNAKLRGNTTFDCQHGPSECLLNTVEACAIDVWPELNKHFQFIYCVENLVYEHMYPQWETCFDKLGLDPKLISDCYTSGYGTKLELKYAAETNSLVPPHQYVPWVVVDGQPLYEDYENFISYICKAYQGTVMPEACSKITLISNLRVKSKSAPPVCVKETTTLPTRIKSAMISWAHKMNTATSA